MASPFQRHLNTNYAPSEEEIEKIGELLIEPLSKLSNFESQIDELLRKRNALKESIEAHRALMSPFRRLPCDVIQEIFFRCLPTDRNCAMSCEEAPVLLCRVCRAWRRIAMTTPAMWTSLHIPVPDRSDAETPSVKTKQRSEVVSEWLGRSGSLPLSISFFESLPQGETERRHTSSTTELLFLEVLRHSGRWKRMHFEVSGDLVQIIMTLPQDLVPTLESLTIIRHPKSSDTLLPLQSLPQSLRQLSLIRLAGISSVQRLGSLQLTHLTLHHRSHQDVNPLQILKECSQLRSCDLSLPCGATNGGLVVTLPFLHEFYFCEVTNSADFFTHLILPALRRLRFKTSLANTNHSLLDFLSHLFKLGTRLKSLDLDTRSFLSDGIIKCLNQTPHLSRLVLRSIDQAATWSAWVPSAVTNTIFGKLTPENGQNSICWLAHLEELECDVVNTFSHQSLLTAVQARVQAPGDVRKLNHLKLNIKCDVEQDFVVKLQNLAAQGLLRLQLNFISGQVINHTPTNYSPWSGIRLQPSWD